MVTKYSEESEKSIEKYLTERLKALGGIALKYYNPSSTGWPDRVAMLPGGHTFWVELKSKGKAPTPLQSARIFALKDMGVHVHVCDSKEKVDKAISSETAYAINKNLIYTGSTRPKSRNRLNADPDEI